VEVFFILMTVDFGG